MKQKEKNLIACSLAHSYNHGILYSHSIAIPLLADYYSLTYSEVGWMSTLFLVAYSLTSFPVGKYCHRLGRKNLIVFHLFGIALVMFLTGLSHNFFHVIVFQIFSGFLAGMYHPPGNVVLINSFKRHERGKALGYHELGGVSGTMCVAIIGGIIASMLGWRYLFNILTLPGLLIAFLCVIFIKETKSYQENNMHNEVKTNLPVVVGIIICTGLHMLAVIGFRTWCPTLLMDRFGINIWKASLLTALVPAASMITSPIFGHLSDRFGREVILYTVLLTFSASLILLAFSQSIYFVGVVLILSGAVYIAIIPIGNAYLSDSSAGSKRGQIFGIHTGFMFLTQAIAPVTIGTIADASSLAYGMVFLSFLSLLSFLVIIVASKYRPKKEVLNEWN